MLRLSREQKTEEKLNPQDMDALKKELVGPTEIYITKLYTVIAVLALLFIILLLRKI